MNWKWCVMKCSLMYLLYLMIKRAGKLISHHDSDYDTCVRIRLLVCYISEFSTNINRKSRSMFITCKNMQFSALEPWNVSSLTQHSYEYIKIPFIANPALYFYVNFKFKKKICFHSNLFTSTAAPLHSFAAI